MVMKLNLNSIATGMVAAITWCIVAVSAGIWLGTIVFHGAIVAPTVFRSLDETNASAFLRALFPRYYRMGIVCGLTLSAALLISASLQNWPTVMLWQTGAALLMTALTVYSLRLVPLINAARDAGAQAQAVFDALHKRAVALNLVILLFVFGIVLASGASISGML